METHTDVLRQALAAIVLFCCTSLALAVIRPSFQPSHLLASSSTVLAAEVMAADEGKREISLRVTRVCQGRFAAKDVTLEVPADAKDETGRTLLDVLDTGDCVVACLSKRRQDQLVLYAHDEWFTATVADADKPRWKCGRSLGDTMKGCFNGAPERLVELMEDLATGQDFFPPVPLVHFREDLVLDKLPQPVRGVALYDIDGDGRLDVYACSAAGNRAYVQAGPLKFEDRTKALGLEGIAGSSVGIADISADGRPDLLADGVIYLQSPDGRFRRSNLLPAEANRNVLSAALADINGDGLPDAIVSRAQGGLALYLSPGESGNVFTEATRNAGLDRPECGAGQTGFFALGDWNDDGRMDLYYAAGAGLLLVQDAKGAFAPLAHKVNFDYAVPGGEAAGLTGAGAFAPLWREDRWDLVSPGDAHLVLLTNERGVPTNVVNFGNELRQCVPQQVATLAEDLNMDGRVDLLTITRGKDTRNVLHTNRGYGSFMCDGNYIRGDALPGKAMERGAGGVAAGDADGDGANDVLLGGADGTLALMLSDVLRARAALEPTGLEKRLQQIAIASVAVRGKRGVTGARVELADGRGRIVARRMIGSQVLTGCRGPDSANIAVREPGAHRLTVRWSDGRSRTWPVDLGAGKRISVEAE